MQLSPDSTGWPKGKSYVTPLAHPQGTPGSSPGQALPCRCADGLRTDGQAAHSSAQKQRHPTPTLPCRQGRERQARKLAALRSCSCSCSCSASGAHDARPLFRGPSAAVSRGRSGRAAGEAMDGLAFSTGQESGRKARPRLTDFPSMDGRKAPPRGALSLWLLSLWACKEKVARAAAAARNRSVACDNAEAKAPLTPTLSPSGKTAGGEGERTRQDVAQTSTGAQS